MASFDDFHASLGLTNFSAAELLTRTDRPTNSVPPSRIWDHIAPTILVLQRLRTEAGFPFTLNSVYRAHAYNKHIPDSARLSQHVAFNAIDFTVADRDRLPGLHDRLVGLWDRWVAAPRRYERVPVDVEGDAIAYRPLEWRADGPRHAFRFRGGVKLYNTFIHVDTRGQNGSWG